MICISHLNSNFTIQLHVGVAYLNRLWNSKHFDTSLTFFWWLFELIWILQVYFIFCFRIKIQKKVLEPFFTGPGLTHEAEPHWQVGHGHGGSHVGCQASVWRNGDIIAGGSGSAAHGAAAPACEGASGGARSTRHGEGYSLVAAPPR